MGAPWKGSWLCNHIRCYREEILGRVSGRKLNQREAALGTRCYHNYLLSDDCRTGVDVDAELPSPLSDEAVLACGLPPPSTHLFVLCFSLLFFFTFFSLSPHFSQEHRLRAKKNANIVLVRSSSEIGGRTCVNVYVRARADSGGKKKKKNSQKPHHLHRFK